MVLVFQSNQYTFISFSHFIALAKTQFDVEWKFEQTPGDSEGQGSLASYSPPGHKESDTT